MGFFSRWLLAEKRVVEAERLLDHIMCTLATGMPMPHCEFSHGWQDIADAVEELLRRTFAPEGDEPEGRDGRMLS